MFTFSKVDKYFKAQGIYGSFNSQPNNIEDFDSSRVREEGNSFYREGKYYHAISSYTQAYSYAEEGSQDVGLALANRSAVLMAVGFYNVN
jgi:predicted S18 family serine protease